MKPALLLIDLQNDYLANPNLQPSAAEIIDAASFLLYRCREAAIPVLHIQTTVQRDPDNRMPHWKKNSLWICEAGTLGHSPPSQLLPRPEESIIGKQFFSGFSNPILHETLQQLGCDVLLLAGLHIHACIRATALDAYAKGYRVVIDQNASASDDPLHAAITRRYLAQRGVLFSNSLDLVFYDEIKSAPCSSSITLEKSLDQDRYQHKAFGGPYRLPWEFTADSSSAIDQIAAAASNAWRSRPVTSFEHRAGALRNFADRLTSQLESLAQQVCADVGKPITMARAEVRRSAELLRVVADQSSIALETRTTPDSICRYQPLGVVAAVTPWNNPCAIPIGKIAPALLYDNAVVWKPAPAATMIARSLLNLWRDAGGAEHLSLVVGGHEAASLLAANPHIDAVTLSGSCKAGYALQEICARRHVPFQAELGGNNAAIIAEDADLQSAALQIAHAAFGFAGQRCTANRRVIVPESLLDSFMNALAAATAGLVWDDPSLDSTVVGPVISDGKMLHLCRLIGQCRKQGLRTLVPHEREPHQFDHLLPRKFVPPTLILCDNPAHEIVQEESFGPILILQPATSFDHALELLNGVRQGLVAALFSNDPELQQQFLRHARAGILKINQATADADAYSPFGGWKASGIGPPEHGPADREFFTRAQTIYGL